MYPNFFLRTAAPLCAALAVLGLVYSGLTYAAGNPSKCKPLLVAYGGALDSQTGIVKGLATRLKNNIPGVVLYHTYDEEFISSNLIRGHLKRFPSSPVVLMGHSYGGDTAYGAAEGWNRNIRLLVTIDPVGGRAYPPRLKFTEFKRHPKRPSNVASWINVFIDPPGALQCILLLGYVWNWDNCIADTGAQWGHQENARNRKFEGNHADVDGMFRLVERDVFSALKC